MKALVLVDLQNDFCPGGALGVNEGDKVMTVANRLLHAGVCDLVVATQDWHPPAHKSFASNNGAEVMSMGELNGVPQVMWPDHCMWGTHGAEFHKDAEMDYVQAIFRKGTNPQVDSYSGFFDNEAVFNGKKVRHSTGMGEYLKGLGVTDVYVLGLATDFCVKFTTLDAVGLGFNTHLVTDGCRGVNLTPGDSEAAVKEMVEAGAKTVTSDELLGAK